MVRRAKPNLDELLRRAAGKGLLKECRSLIQQGANVNAADMHGKTALMRASITSIKGSIDVMRLLLDAGADINAVDVHGWGALMRAANYRRHEACQFLIDRGADVQGGGKEDGIPLVLAASEGKLNACRVLVEHGASPSYIPAEASLAYLTPFQRAVHHGHEDVTAYFINECNETIHQTSLAGKTLFELAEGNPDILALLFSIKTTESVAGAFEKGGAASGGTAPKKGIMSL